MWNIELLIQLFILFLQASLVNPQIQQIQIIELGGVDPTPDPPPPLPVIPTPVVKKVNKYRFQPLTLSTLSTSLGE